jgi:uncharacterized protein (DUF302 family)
MSVSPVSRQAHPRLPIASGTFHGEVGSAWIDPHVILGACNPSLARQALEAEPQIGLLLPCNVVVQEAPAGRVVVSIGDPKAMFSLVDNPAVAPVAAEVDARLRRVMASLERHPAGAAM